MFYGKVFKALNKAKVKYVVAGGTAVVLHGYERFTNDLDLYVFLENKNLEKLFKALQVIGFIPKVPVTKEQFCDKKTRNLWKKDKGMVVFSFVDKNPPFQLIDIFVDEPIKFTLVYKHSKRIKVNNVTIPFMSIEHLIHLKKKAARIKDLDDIAHLNGIKKILKKKNDKNKK